MPQTRPHQRPYFPSKKRRCKNSIPIWSYFRLFAWIKSLADKSPVHSDRINRIMAGSRCSTRESKREFIVLFIFPILSLVERTVVTICISIPPISPPIPFLIIVRRFWLNLAWGKASTVDDWITLLTVATACLNRRQVPMNRLTISVMGWREGNGGCASGEKEKKARRLHSIAPFLSALECLLPGFRAKSYVSVWSRESFICIRCFVGFKGEMWFCWWGLWKDNLESNW